MNIENYIKQLPEFLIRLYYFVTIKYYDYYKFLLFTEYSGLSAIFVLVLDFFIVYILILVLIRCFTFILKKLVYLIIKTHYWFGILIFRFSKFVLFGYKEKEHQLLSSHSQENLLLKQRIKELEKNNHHFNQKNINSNYYPSNNNSFKQKQLNEKLRKLEIMALMEQQKNQKNK
jgi:hypothetical protein